MLANSRLVYFFVYVNDLTSSRAFYKDKLGLRIIEEDPGCVKFDCGAVILALNKAADFNIPLPQSRDRSTEIVFMVDSVVETREALVSRGVQVNPASSEEPGHIATFYDPDGHWYCLYEPSEEALSWSSGKRLRALMSAPQSRKGKKAAARSASKSSSGTGDGWKGLDGSKIVYAFLFVQDTAETEVFYHDDLGLLDLEGGPCSQTSSDDDMEGVIKYDGGGVFISTHLRHSFDPTDGHLKSVVSVFCVKNIEHVVKTLSRRRAGFTSGITRSGIGAVASFADPSGHQFYLYEPSEEALQTPSGKKIQEILAATF